MSIIPPILRRKKQEAFDPNPEETREMPVRPFRVLYSDLPFFSDAKCQNEVQGARLLVLQCEDTIQKQKVAECVPSRKLYKQGQIVTWGLNNKLIWETSWYRNPATGQIEKAWTQAVEFAGMVVAADVVASSATPGPTAPKQKQTSASQAG